MGNHQTQHQRKIKARRRKSVVSIGKMNRPTHLRAMILICPMTVILEVNDLKIKTLEKGSDQTMRNFNSKIADDSI